MIKPTKRWNQVRIRSGSKVVPLKEEISEEVDKKSKRPEELRCDLVTTTSLVWLKPTNVKCWLMSS